MHNLDKRLTLICNFKINIQHFSQSGRQKREQVRDFNYGNDVLCYAVVLLGLAWSMVAVTIIMMVVGYDILPIVFEQIPLDIVDNKFFRRGLAWQHRNEDAAIYEVSCAISDH